MTSSDAKKTFQFFYLSFSYPEAVVTDTKHISNKSLYQHPLYNNQLAFYQKTFDTLQADIISRTSWRKLSAGHIPWQLLIRNSKFISSGPLYRATIATKIAHATTRNCVAVVYANHVLIKWPEIERRKTENISVDWPSKYEAVSLIHWGRVTHIGVRKLNIIGSNHGLSPSRR